MESFISIPTSSLGCFHSVSGKALGIGNRLIEVHRCDMETVPFPNRKDS